MFSRCIWRSTLLVAEGLTIRNASKSQFSQQICKFSSSSYFKNTTWSQKLRQRALLGGSIGGVGLIYGTVLVAKKDSDKYESEEGSLDVQAVDVFKPHPRGGEIHVSRKVVNPLDTSGLNIRLYQYQACPFCCKVRAFLDYYGFSYEVVEVNPVSRNQLKFTNYKKVPCLVIQGKEKELHDSTFMISLLRSYMLDPKQDFQNLANLYPHLKTENEKGKEVVVCHNKYFVMFHDKVKTNEAIANKKEEREWREWVDDVFIHMISPNVYTTLSESKRTFKWFSEFSNYDGVFPWYEKLVVINIGSLAMYIIGKRLKKRHALKDDVRQSLYDAARTWDQSLGQRKFMGGNEPNLADLALYGAITSFEGTSAFKDMMQNTDIGNWFYAVKEMVQNRNGSTEFVKNLQ